MANERKPRPGELGTMRSFEEYHARVFPRETERRRFESDDPAVLGRVVADRVIKRMRAHPSLVAGHRRPLEKEEHASSLRSNRLGSNRGR